MTGDIKLNSGETRALDEVINAWLQEINIMAREVDIAAVNKSAGNNYTISVQDKK